MSWVAGRLSPGTATPAVATLDNLRASLLGLGNVRCSVAFPRCDGVHPTRDAPAPYVDAGVPTDAGADVTTPLSVDPGATATTGAEAVASPPATPTPPTASLTVGHGIIHPAYSDLPKIITVRPTGGATATPPRASVGPSHFTAIGVKTNKNKRRRRPGPRASARKAPRQRRADKD